MDIEILILAQLIQGSKHGYEIKKNIIFVMANKKIINNNTLYPKLKQLEKRGLVSKKIELQGRRPNRIVYSITNSGKELFHKYLISFTVETIKSDDEWSIRLAYYDLLDAEIRQRLLSYRLEYVFEKLKRLQQLSLIVEDSKQLLYSKELYFYTQNMMEREKVLILDLISKLGSNTPIYQNVDVFDKKTMQI